MSYVKYILVFTLSIGLFAIGYFGYTNLANADQNSTAYKPLSKVKEAIKSNPKYNSELENKDILSVAILGIDRRHRSEGFRTDIMIVVAINKKTNRIVMASVPRDLWWKNGRINAAYIQGGWEDLQAGLTEVTGIKPDKFVLTDFEDFKWVVDAMGGVPVNIETTFTDTQYPVDATFEYQTVAFSQGTEVLTGERALIFSRSRKGDNDSGDWGRMKRQHLILRGMLTAITQPQSTFKNMSPEDILKTVTNAKMDSNLTPSDASYIWDLYKDKDKYTITSLYLDHDYLFTPPMSEYGGAWVLAPIGGTFEPFKTKFMAELSGTPVPAKAEPNLTTQTPEE